MSVLVLHPDSRMTSGSSFKSDSTFVYSQVQFTPTLNPQFNDTRLFKFESLNPDVGGILSSIHAIDPFANFVFVKFLTIFLKVCSADVLVSQLQ